MARNTSISLGEHFVEFIDRQVQGGRFGSASDVVRAGLRLLEEQEARLQSLRAELAKGEASGEFEELDINAFVASKRDRQRRT